MGIPELGTLYNASWIIPTSSAYIAKLASSCSVFDRGEKRGQKTVLQDEHKEYLIRCYDATPDITVVEATEQLTKQFAGLKITKSAVYDFMRKECNLSIKRAHFQAAARNN
ncbi:hypothetical protein DFQ28_000918 [Apophysomyces sp. BC1034]|nr:hypothetical protein DFQ28_000918 [Apophysomyces sp. BC1034]